MQHSFSLPKMNGTRPLSMTRLLTRVAVDIGFIPLGVTRHLIAAMAAMLTQTVPIFTVTMKLIMGLTVVSQ